MKLIDSHIEELYKFTRQHFVEYYDVQTELVDHLANDIEAIWMDEPKLSFEKARDLSFKKFGVFGFMDVVAERSKVLNKKYWKLVWNIFKEFFKIPQIITLLIIWISVFFSFQYFPDKSVYLIVEIGGFIIIMFQLILLRKVRKKRFKKTKKKWLLEEYILNLGNISVFLNLLLQISFNSPEITHPILLLLISFILTSFILFIYITAFHLPSKVDEILINQYPEYNLVTN